MSKFGNLKAARALMTSDAPAPSEPEAPPAAASPTATPIRSGGRQRGKVSDPNYAKVAFLLHTSLYMDLQRLLLELNAQQAPGHKVDASDVVNYLLRRHLSEVGQDGVQAVLADARGSGSL